MLINNSIESLYNGVSEQAPEHRQNTQVKEMINAYPSIDKGLLRRNPTFHRNLTSTITYTDDMWTHAYDRGLSGTSSEKYSINIVESGMEIINLETGKIYKEGSGLTYVGNAKQYLKPFVPVNGYSAVTIKDTTFILNKNVNPNLNQLTTDTTGTGTTQNVTANIATINFGNPIRKWWVNGIYYNVNSEWVQSLWGPTKVHDGFNATAMGSATSVSVDGTIIIYDLQRQKNVIRGYGYDSFSEWKANLLTKISDALNSSLYTVSSDSSGNISIMKLDGSALSVSFSISFNPLELDDGTPIASVYPTLDSQESDYYSGITTSTKNITYTVTPSNYKKDGFVWVKGANPTSGYTYSVNCIDSNGVSVVANTTQTTSNAAASALASTINAHASFSATANGSVIKVTAVNGEMKSVTSSDTYGNTAIFSWTKEVEYNTDLPKSLGFDSVVKVIGKNAEGYKGYWLRYSDGLWREYKDPFDNNVIVADTMPHVLTRNSNDTFTLSAWDKWDEKKVGDTDSNPVPSFLVSSDNPDAKIKDIFFFKNRLGFITQRTIALSEVGKYGNFWRTTVSTLLDSDPIDTTIDTTKAISLEYASYLEDRIMIFSDKAQFKLEGGNILSPASVQVSQTSSYNINKMIRPVYMNDKIFFCVDRGGYTAVMQYQVKSTNTSSEAIDITAHVQSYIPAHVRMMTGDPINNMLFLSFFNSDTVYVYKYYDVGSDRLQSAWFKYQFNGIVYRAFSLGTNLNIFIKRKKASVVEDWVVGTGIWESAKLWDSSNIWISSPDDLEETNQFETMQIAPQDYNSSVFRDVDNTNNSTQFETNVNFGEWVASFDNNKDIRGILKFKSVVISSEAGSDFGLYIKDTHRGDTRVISSKYTVDRKPMVYGDAKNIEVGISSTSSSGFRINTVNYEGSFNSRSKKY